MEFAETKVAVGEKGAHAQLLSQRDGLFLARGRHAQIWGIGEPCNVAEDVQRPRFIPSLAATTRNFQSVGGKLERVVRPACPQVDLAEPTCEECVSPAHSDELAQTIPQERNGLFVLTGQRVSVAQRANQCDSPAA